MWIHDGGQAAESEPSRNPATAHAAQLPQHSPGNPLLSRSSSLSGGGEQKRPSSFRLEAEKFSKVPSTHHEATGEANGGGRFFLITREN